MQGQDSSQWANEPQRIIMATGCVPVRLETTFKPYTTTQTIRHKLWSGTVFTVMFMTIKPKIYEIMKCQWLLVTVLAISVKAAPLSEQQAMNQVMRNQLDQSMLNQIAHQSMEQWILQDQYNLQQQLIMQQLQNLNNNAMQQVPMLFNLPSQPIIMLMPNTMTKASNRLENLYGNFQPNPKLGIGDADTVVVDAENESNVPEMGIIPRRVVVLPNGQRLIIGSIISAIPFLPFEVNVPDTIAWIYNGLAGIIGGIGQRLPFRPKPTTENTVSQESMASSQESMNQDQGAMTPEMTQDNRLQVIQKLMNRKQSMGIPIILFPLAQTMPIQVPNVPIQV